MLIRTRKCQLSKKFFTKINFIQAMKDFWWAWTIPPAIILIGLFYNPIFWTMCTIALILLILYPLFWFIVLKGIPEMPENKSLFEKMEYEISTQGIMAKTNKHGMHLTWDMIKKISQKNNAIFIKVSRFHFIHLPFQVFKNKNDILILKAILKRKNIILD